ncbi:MAG: radical SAM protein [Lachnospiraceae bacterium]|nr:radical SAM protein [Lachnospiraceae bacterium]
MDTKTSLLPVFNIVRHRLQTDGKGVTTLVGAYGCPLRCRYCLNPHAWNPETLKKCMMLTPEALYEKVKIDELYFLATGGGVTFGGGESLLHVDFIRRFRELCGPDWTLTLETSLNVPEERFLRVLDSVNDFIVDIKDLDPSVYEAYTGVPIRKAAGNLELLAKRVAPEHVHIRVPRIPEYNSQKHVLSSLKKLKGMGFENIEIFPYIIRPS